MSSLKPFCLMNSLLKSVTLLVFHVEIGGRPSRSPLHQRFDQSRSASFVSAGPWRSSSSPRTIPPVSASAVPSGTTSPSRGAASLSAAAACSCSIDIAAGACSACSGSIKPIMIAAQGPRTAALAGGLALAGQRAALEAALAFLDVCCADGQRFCPCSSGNLCSGSRFLFLLVSYRPLARFFKPCV